MGSYPLLQVQLPAALEPGMSHPVDVDHSLVVEVFYDACSWEGPFLVGVGPDQIEVRQAEIMRLCYQPIPRLASFTIPWSELPARFTIADQHGTLIVIADRERV